MKRSRRYVRRICGAYLSVLLWLGPSLVATLLYFFLRGKLGFPSDHMGPSTLTVACYVTFLEYLCRFSLEPNSLDGSFYVCAVSLEMVS